MNLQSYSRVLQRITIVMVLAISFSLAQAEPALSVDLTTRDLLKQMESRSPALMSLEADLARSRAKYTGSRALPNPEFFYSREQINLQDERDLETTIGIAQNLSFLWEKPLEISSRRTAYKSAVAGFEDNLLALKSEIILSVIRLEQLSLETALFDSTMERMKFVSRAAEKRRDVGEISPLEAKRIVAEYAMFLSRHTEVISDRQGELIHLTHLTGLSLDDLERVTPDIPNLPVGLTPESAARHAKDNGPLLRKLQLRASAGRKQVSARKLSMIPEVNLGIGRKAITGGFFGPVLNLSVEIPIFAQGRSALNEARAAYLAEQSDYETVQRTIVQELNAAFQQLARLERDTVELYHEDYSAATTISKSATMYLQGEMTATEFVDAAGAAIESLEAIHILAIRRAGIVLGIRRLIGADPLD